MARNSIAPGGYIGGEPPRRPMFNQLSGVWKLDDVLERQKNNAWTNALGVEDVFSTYLYTGNGSTQTITNGIDLSGKGGLVWIKQRSAAQDNLLVDTARGASNSLVSNSTSAGNTIGNGIGSNGTFNSNGFTLANGTAVYGNQSGSTYASWTFRKQAKFFDVVTYTGNGGTQNIAHNLGSAPGCIIIKSTSSATNWIVYHRGVGATQFLQLNQTNAAGTFFDYWNNTAPTSTQFTLGAAAATNTNGENYVAYLFAHDAGGFGDSGNDNVVSCGSFTGGTFVDLGWEPQWILMKATGVADGWRMFDNMRGLTASGTNEAMLQANSSNAESATGDQIDIAPTGFTPNSGIWGSFAGIYIAIRRGPMKTPTDATKVLYQLSRNGTGAETQVSGFGFPPDMMLTLWRSGGGSASQGSIIDKLRGNAPRLEPRGTAAEVTASSPTSYLALKSFDQDGVTYGQDQFGGYVNFSSSYLYMNYFFRRAPGFFDVVAYTGTGSARTIAHNLGVAPELMIIKSRSGGFGWAVYSSFLGPSSHVRLNLDLQALGTTMWNNTAPSPTVFSVLDASFTNASSYTYIAYLFASCPGVSKVGSYTGTGTTQQINCGFANGARFVLIKRTDSTGDWYVWDTARGIVSGNDPSLLLNSTAAEVTNTDYIDPYSPGFEISSTAPAAINANGGSFVFLAIA